MITSRAEIGLFDDIIIDSFAGGGGASTGIELATGHPVDIAINHSESAIMMHKINHPYTEHYKEDIWQVDPVKVARGRHVRLAWFSPDCKHFSRAKGAALVDKHIRGLAWVVLRFAGTVRPDVIMLENVPEFITWGPVRKGKPVKSKSGQTFNKWLAQLKALGYKVGMKNLCAADYGAPTTRTRFCLIARCDGEEIHFPERTHAPRDSEEVRSGRLKPWVSAAEIIDWTLPCYSIFESRQEIKEKYGVNCVRPLKPNTLRRIAMGLDKFVLKSNEPFIIPIGYGEKTGQTPRTHDVKEPLPTVVASMKHYLVSPTLVQYHTETTKNGVRASGLPEPLPTVDGSNRYALAAAHPTQYFGGEGHYHSVDKPLATVTACEREGVVAAYLSKYYGGVTGAEISNPLPTVTAIDHNALAGVYLADFRGKDVGVDVRKPLMTIMSRGKFAQVVVKIKKADVKVSFGFWTEIRKLLNEYCGYNLAGDEVLLLKIGDELFFMSDICLRMLSPRELYDAMGFPHDYVIDRYADGSPISRADQVARCGNAVCPAMAEAMVRANLQDECLKGKIITMDRLHERMTS